MVWIAMASIVVVGWLVVSFSEPSHHRTIIEWVSATAMFIGLFTFFIFLAQKAHAADNTFAVWAFGFLCVLFGGGLIVSTWHTLSALGSAKKSESSTTN